MWKVSWGRIFILVFAYISRKFPSDPGFVFLKNEEISGPPSQLIADC